MNKVLRVFFDVNMGQSHAGLASLASTFKVNVHSLDEGEHVVFINRAMDKMKIFSANNVLGYLKVDGKLSVNSFNYFTDAYGAKAFQYDKMLEKVLQKRLGVSGRRPGHKGAIDANALSA